MAELSLRDVSRLRTLLPLDNLELDVIAFGERLEAASLNGAEVDKDIGPSLSRDEAVAFGVVEPLHRTLESCHEPYLFELCSDPLPSQLARPLTTGRSTATGIGSAAGLMGRGASFVQDTNVDRRHSQK